MPQLFSRPGAAEVAWLRWIYLLVLSCPPSALLFFGVTNIGIVCVSKDNHLLNFSKKLITAKQKYSAYDRVLLAVYEAIRHFLHMLEAPHFSIFTDHKRITVAFQQNTLIFT